MPESRNAAILHRAIVGVGDLTAGTDAGTPKQLLDAWRDAACLLYDDSVATSEFTDGDSLVDAATLEAREALFEQWSTSYFWCVLGICAVKRSSAVFDGLLSDSNDLRPICAMWLEYYLSKARRTIAFLESRSRHNSESVDKHVRSLVADYFSGILESTVTPMGFSAWIRAAFSETSDQVACWKLLDGSEYVRRCASERESLEQKKIRIAHLRKGIVPNMKIRPDLGQTFTVYKSSNGSARSVCVCTNCPYATIATQQGIREVNLNSCMRHGRKLEDDGSETSWYKELYRQDMRKQSLNGTEDQLKRRDSFNVIVPEFSIQLRPSRSALGSGNGAMGSGRATSHDLPSTHLAAHPTKAVFAAVHAAAATSGSMGYKSQPKVVIWGVAAAEPVAEFPLYPLAPNVSRIRFTPNGAGIGVIDEKSFAMWDYQPTRRLLVQPRCMASCSDFDYVFPGGTSIVVAGSPNGNDGGISMFDFLVPPRSRKCMSAILTRKSSNRSSSSSLGVNVLKSAPTRCVYIPWSQQVLLGTSTGELGLFDMRQRVLVNVFSRGHSRGVTALEIDAAQSGGTLIASGSKDGVVKLWDVEGKLSEIAGFEAHRKGIVGISFCDVGMMSCGGDGAVKLTRI